MGEDEIDTSDIPPLAEDFFARAELRSPVKDLPIKLNAGDDVLE